MDGAHAPPTNMPLSEIDEDLNRLEKDIRQFKIEYEQYFGGGKTRPPNDTEWRIESVVKRYGDRGAQLNYSQRFRYSNLTQTYARYRDVFHKRLKKREEGSVERHYGAAARAIEAERATHTPPAEDRFRVAVTCADPLRESNKLDQLYGAFREALSQSGESTDRLSRQSFEQFLQKKAEQLRGKQNERDVEFVVSVEGGKARLKARLKS